MIIEEGGKRRRIFILTTLVLITMIMIIKKVNEGKGEKLIKKRDTDVPIIRNINVKREQ